MSKRLGPYSNISTLFRSIRNNSANLKAKIDKWCNDSFKTLKTRHVDPQRNIHNSGSELWVIKYMSPKYLSNFFEKKRRKLNVSLGSNFTWGDATYVTPLYSSVNGIVNPQMAYASAMFGRAGIVGYTLLDNSINQNQLKVFDATKDSKIGIEIYKEWIATQTSLYDHLVTSAHSQMARYYLSKIFRWTYEIDIVYFNPDEYNARYVNRQIIGLP